MTERPQAVGVEVELAPKPIGRDPPLRSRSRFSGRALRKHFHCAEYRVVVRGTTEVTIDDRVVLRHESETAYLLIGSVHRIANPGKIDREMIEVQVGNYTGKDDISRLGNFDRR